MIGVSWWIHQMLTPLHPGSMFIGEFFNVTTYIVFRKSINKCWTDPRCDLWGFVKTHRIYSETSNIMIFCDLYKYLKHGYVNWFFFKSLQTVVYTLKNISFFHNFVNLISFGFVESKTMLINCDFFLYIFIAHRKHYLFITDGQLSPPTSHACLLLSKILQYI